MSNPLAAYLAMLKKLLIYRPPSTPPPFVLEEREGADGNAQPSVLTRRANELGALLRHARRLEKLMLEVRASLAAEPGPDAVKALQVRAEALEKQQAELAPLLLAYGGATRQEDANISASLAENLRTVRRLFRLPTNRTIVLRRFVIPASPPLDAALVFSKELADKKDINSAILLPLLGAKDVIAEGDGVFAALVARHLPVNDADEARDFRTVVRGVTGGDTALFVDGAAAALLIETKGFEHRAISRPAIEQTVRGNQSAFTDTLRINISLVSRALRSADLVTDIISLGARGRTDCAVIYLASVANPALVAEVKRRLAAIRTDYLAIGTLEQFIEDRGFLPLPQTISSEKPDRVTAHLAEGRVAVLLDGDPFALVVPATFFTLLHSPEDFALKPPSGTFMRLLRLAAALLAVLLPSVYVAIVYYHPEALPTDLLLTIAGSRERIPFPAFFEVLVMELSLEFVREASSRVPGVLGEATGIVGGIILGQAVVTANLISPVTVVIVAITALASFTIPDYRVGMFIRQSRFVFLVAAAVLGLVGVAGLIFVGALLTCAVKSFGVPFLAPIAPAADAGRDAVVRGPVNEQELRPDTLNTLDRRRQPSVSRGWAEKDSEGGGGEADQ
ncbi:MAG: spore germination protein [Sporomusaceae bacterium]|nr:spore germination protein [Sporomusaceae bacterium]